MGTKITINENIGSLTGMLLNIAELEKNTEYTKIAYCSSVDVGDTTDGKKFFKFMFFDRGGHQIVGRIFNIESVAEKGITANNLKSSVVKIRFSLSTFGGTNSLTVHQIDPIPEKALSREEFIGEIPDIDSDVEFVNSVAREVCSNYGTIGKLITKYHLLSGIHTVTMPNLWAERKGGAVKFSAMFIKMVRNAFSVDGEEKIKEIDAVLLLSEIFMYWKYAANYEENILSLGDNINEILAKTDKYLNAVMDMAKSLDSKVEYNICKETKHLLKCYFGYDTPKTYVSMSLCSFRDSLLEKLRIQEEYDSMLDGTYKNISDGNGGFVKLVRLNER